MVIEKVLHVHTKDICKNVRNTSDYHSQKLETIHQQENA